MSLNTIIVESQLYSEVKKTVNIVQFSFAYFKLIRNNLYTESAKLFINLMILPHITYCLTSWSQTCNMQTCPLKPIEIVYKQALKVLDIQSTLHHH